MFDFVPKTGESLKDDVENLVIVRTPLIEEFIYEKSITLISADPGIGKSAIAQQVAMTLTTGAPVFGCLNVPVPKKVYYMQLEGSYYETIERMRIMNENIEMDYSNLCWDIPPMLNCASDTSTSAMIKRIHDTQLNPDLIIIDPIYMAVSGDLKEGDVCTKLLRFCEMLRKEFDCALMLIHHTCKSSTDREGNEITKDDPYYGSQWLKAYVDTSYILKKFNTNTASGVELHNKKMRGSNVKKFIRLPYDAETRTNRVAERGRPAQAIEAVLKLLEERSETGGFTTFNEVVEKTGLSDTTVHRIRRELIKSRQLVIDKNGGVENHWKLVTGGNE